MSYLPIISISPSLKLYTWKTFSLFTLNQLVLVQSCPALWDHMDCSPPGSSVHGILQARIPFPSPGDFPNPGIEFMSRVSFIAGRFLTIWAIREAPRLWPPDVKSWLTEKDPDAGKDWGQEEKGATEDEMVGRHHRLNGQEFEQTLGDGEGQGSMACCSPRGHKELDMT